MALPYFYEKDINNDGRLILSEETARHCIQVLRMKIGEQLNITDGAGNIFTSVITEIGKKTCVVKVEEKKFQPKSSKQVSIAISLLKNTARFEWFLEKATEIGVTEIVPLICHRTERQHFRFDRMNKILISAMLQSQQAWLPPMHEPQIFEQYLHQTIMAGGQKKLIAHCIENEKTELKNFSAQYNIQIFIGPEGDFTNEEISLALQNNFTAVSLGSTRLRTETAGIVAAAILMEGI
jgi:RNA methyltransferase, RsmE family